MKLVTELNCHPVHINRVLIHSKDLLITCPPYIKISSDHS